MVLLGPPGAGKGTQGERLAQALGVPHVATGDIVREHIAHQTPFGLKVQAAIAAGNFAPDSDIIYWVWDRLSRPDARAGYILDGFPRDLFQAQALDENLTAHQTALDAVVELTLDEAAVLERLAGRLVCPLCGRACHCTNQPPRRAGRCDVDGTALVRRPDDEPAAVRNRLQVYERTTLPLRAYYARQGLLVPVDGNGAPDVVYSRLVRALESRPARPKNVDFKV